MNRIITQFPANSARPVKKARNGATNIIVDTDGSLMVQTYDGVTAPVVVPSTYATYTVQVDIPASGITSLNSTPVQIIPSPGAGVFIEPLGAVMYLHSATSGYTSGATASLYLQFDTVSFPVFTIDISDSPTMAGSMRNFTAANAGVNYTNIIPNQPLNIWAPGGNPHGGDGALSIWVTYRIIAL